MSLWRFESRLHVLLPLEFLLFPLYLPFRTLQLPYVAGSGQGIRLLGKKAIVDTSIGTIAIVKNMKDV